MALWGFQLSGFLEGMLERVDGLCGGVGSEVYDMDLRRSDTESEMPFNARIPSAGHTLPLLKGVFMDKVCYIEV